MSNFNISSKITELSEEASRLAQVRFSQVDSITEYNQQRVLKAFTDHRVSAVHFNPTNGYGYDDAGRDTLDALYADVLGTEDALVRYSLASGTHTLSVMLYGILRPGDTILSVTGTPYDTICPVFGITGSYGGSLKDIGINYSQIDLTPGGEPDIPAIAAYLDAHTVRAVYIQRSRGYTLRPSLTDAKIEEISRVVRTHGNSLILLDNCYGEFVAKTSTVANSVDVMAGSLIKNAGGGIAQSGGYIAGKKELIELCSYRLTAPGVGREIGASLGHNRELYMGLFNAPHVTGEALKTVVFCSTLFELMGYEAFPRYTQDRADIIQSILLGSREKLIAFCKGIQSGSPVDSYVSPVPAPMPGYDCNVIMAAGAFTLGSSIELSADAPLREPFAVWLQGGLNFHSAKVGVMLAAQEVSDC